MQTCKTCQNRGTRHCPIRKPVLVAIETSQLLRRGFCDRWQSASQR